MRGSALARASAEMSLLYQLVVSSVLLGLACSSMIYVAVADLIPGLHRRTRLRETVEQILLIAAGVLSIGGVHHVIEHSGLV